MGSEPPVTVEPPRFEVLGARNRDGFPVIRQLAPTARFLMRTEVHTFAFSVAANAILSFFPFVVLLLVVTRRVFHSQLMYDTVVRLLRDYLPISQDFLIRNLKAMA